MHYALIHLYSVVFYSCQHLGCGFLALLTIWSTGAEELVFRRNKAEAKKSTDQLYDRLTYE